MTWPVTCTIWFYRWIFPYTLRSLGYSGFSFFSSNSILYLQWALLSHSDMRDYLIRIHDYIRYIQYSNPLDPPILIVVLIFLLLRFFEQEGVQPCLHMLKQAVFISQKISEGTMKTQAGWPSHLPILLNFSLRKHFPPQLSKAASHHHQVIAMNFRSLLYRKLLWNFPSSLREKRTMDMRMRLMMTSVSLLNNFFSLHIMV